MKKTAIAISGLIISLLLIVESDQFVLAQQNLLMNPGFEEPYSNGVAQSWSPWNYDSNEKKDCATEIYYVPPFWLPELSPSLVVEGVRSQHVGNNWDTWRGGVSQTVDGLTPGQTYRFEVKMFGRISNSQWPAPSSNGFMNGRVGIDPTGGANFVAPVVIWGGVIVPRDSWQIAAVEAIAIGSSMTIFVEGNFGSVNNCHAHIDIWFDDASLVRVESEPSNLNMFSYLPIVSK